MEIDEEWQTGIIYMKMKKEDSYDIDEYLINEINNIKQKKELKKELVTL